ncbi:hypothetical protein ABIE44_000696 [Marmoricola sp. OAE513]|uniref:hypothetical protein n=1 Tax=Marmoricola sp. OAE513 TaxID=2817894 RepID=UPI001AE6725A
MPARLIAVLPLLLVTSLVAGCGDDNDRSTSALGPEPEVASDWKRLPDLPLSSRYAPVVAWTGTEVLAVGGETGDTCPPNADCQVGNESATDGAALDPATGRWRKIADAPVQVPSYSSSAFVAGTLFIKANSDLLSYEVAMDRWTTLRKISSWYDLEGDGDRLVLASGSDETETLPDLAYDVPRERWSELPADPLGPSFGRGVISTPQGLLLTAAELVENPGSGDQPAYLRAALLDRRTNRWTRVPESRQLGGGIWSVIGDRVVNVALDATNGGGGGKGDYGRMVPFGGVLDVATRTWSDLPDPPKYLSGGWTVEAPGARLVAAEGWIYNDADRTWTRIPRPKGSAERPGPAVWAGDRLVVVTGTNESRTNDGSRDGTVWSWTLPAT